MIKLMFHKNSQLVRFLGLNEITDYKIRRDAYNLYLEFINPKDEVWFKLTEFYQDYCNNRMSESVLDRELYEEIIKDTDVDALQEFFCGKFDASKL